MNEKENENDEAPVRCQQGAGQHLFPALPRDMKAASLGGYSALNILSTRVFETCALRTSDNGMISYSLHTKKY